MKKLLFIISILFVHIAYAQTFNVDNLIKLRIMSKSEIQAYLIKENSNWKYLGFDKGEYFWSLDNEGHDKNIMLILTVSLESENKNIISIITARNEINEQIMNQILKYKMKKIYSKNNEVNGKESLLERYQGANYAIVIKKTFNGEGIILTETILGKN